MDCFRLGMVDYMKHIFLLTLLLTSITFAEDFDETLRLAKEGNANAQFNLGVYYTKGTEVPENYEKAFKWYMKSAQQGIVVAQTNLAFMYLKGNGVPENYNEAFKWFMISAQQGDEDAQNSLGGMYLEGMGVPENYILSYVWFSMAKTSGNKLAVNNIEIVKEKMTKQQVEAGQTLAAKCYKSNFEDCD